MSIKYENKNNAVVVYLESVVDMSTSPVMQRDIAYIADKFPESDIVLNMENVEYMNSAGLGMLIVLTKKLAHSDRSLKITNLNSIIKRVIELLEADDIINIYDNEEDALAPPLS